MIPPHTHHTRTWPPPTFYMPHRPHTYTTHTLHTCLPPLPIPYSVPTTRLPTNPQGPHTPSTASAVYFLELSLKAAFPIKAGWPGLHARPLVEAGKAEAGSTIQHLRFAGGRVPEAISCVPRRTPWGIVRGCTARLTQPLDSSAFRPAEDAPGTDAADSLSPETPTLKVA